MRIELIEIAEQRLRNYNALVSLAEAQREILIGGRHAELLENLNEHDPILVELERLDARAGTLASHLDKNDKSPDFERKLKRLARQISEAASKLEDLVRANAELLTNAMNFVSFSIALISKIATDQQSYNPNSDLTPGLALMLDRKV